MKSNVVKLMKPLEAEEGNVTKRSSDPIDVRAGAHLRVYRNIRHMSQEELAEHNDMTFQQIQKYEKAINRISISRLFKLCDALDVHPADFIKSLSAECVTVRVSEGRVSDEIGHFLGVRGAYDLLTAFADMDAEDRTNLVVLANRLARMNRKTDG